MFNSFGYPNPSKIFACTYAIFRHQRVITTECCAIQSLISMKLIIESLKASGSFMYKALHWTELPSEASEFVSIHRSSSGVFSPPIPLPSVKLSKARR